ncbi:MAG: hypothetical protein IH819_04430, partial [Bacteroidetes bacterium]|nr:hypothetical protein [Bacteroidota bacterium]
MKYLCKILLIILILPSIAHLQEKLQIEEKQAELFQIRNEISQLENDLSKKSEKEKESFDALENYNKQAFLLNKVINKFRNEEAVIQKGIEILEKKIISTKDEIDLLMHNYAVYVVALYKKGVYLEIENVINAESLRQALVRIQYLHKFSERRKDDLEEFIVKKQELLVAKTKLEFEKRKKKLLVAAKESDEKQLKIKLEEGKKILASVKKDKDELKKIGSDALRESYDIIKNYFTEKIVDCFLTWTKPIYFGCPNIKEYFPEGSYEWIDINNPDSINKIPEIIKKPIDYKSLEEARRLVLYNYNIWPCVSKI